MPVIQGSRGATLLVGMPGFVVGASELVDGELWLFIETTADLVGCSGCGTRAVGHGRHKTMVRDLPISGRPTVLIWSKRRWRCPEPDCETKTWSETSPEIAPRAVMTERARKRLADMVNIDPRDVLDTWLTERGDDWCARIRLATLDPSAGYRRALTDHLPNVTLVVDHFHRTRPGASCEPRVEDHRFGSAQPTERPEGMPVEW